MGAENRGKDRMNSRVGAGEKKPPIGREEEREGRKGHEGKHHKGKRYSAIRSKEKRSRPAASAALQSQAGPQATTDSGQRFGLSLTSQMAAEARGDFDHSSTVTGPAMVSSDQQHSQRAPPFQAQCVCNLDKNKTNDCT